jgi:hypothetical protein
MKRRSANYEGFGEAAPSLAGLERIDNNEYNRRPARRACLTMKDLGRL